MILSVFSAFSANNALFLVFCSFYLNRKQFLLYQTVYRDLKTFSGFPAQFCLHLSEKPHLHSLFATFTESRHLCLLFQRFQAVFPLFNALFPLQSRSFSAFIFYRSFTPYLIAVTGDLSRYTPLSVSNTDKQGNSTYRDKIQAESSIKKPSRPLRPCFRFSIRLKLIYANVSIFPVKRRFFSCDRRRHPFFTHLSSFKALSTFSADVLHFPAHLLSQTDHYPPLNAFCTYKKSEALASPRNPALSALFFSLSRFPDPTIRLRLNRL